MTNKRRSRHDESFKVVYGAPEPTADLVKASVEGAWVDELDMGSLALMPNELISESLSIRRSDLIWSVRWRNQRVYIYVMLEFQSRPDPIMPLRMVEYVAALYRSLINSGQIDSAGPYPPVYPLILYHGTPPWLVPKNIRANLASMPAGLCSYNLSLGYQVVDVRRMAADLPADTENLAEAMLRVQCRVRSEDIPPAAAAMLEMLEKTGRSRLWNSFRPWLRELLLQHFPSVRWPRGDSLKEILAMLKSDTIEWKPEWHDPGVELGRAQGLEQGLEKGLEQGASALRQTLNTFAQVRFGQSVAVLVAGAVANISEVDKLAEVGRWIGECDSGEMLLARLRRT